MYSTISDLYVKKKIEIYIYTVYMEIYLINTLHWTYTMNT